jgi:hypothetical protein
LLPAKEQAMQQTPQSGIADARLESLERTVEFLSVELGERNLEDDARYARLLRAEEWIGAQLASTGLDVTHEPYRADGRAVSNIYAERRGELRPRDWVVVGAHFDSARGSPGANDNATGVAVLLALAGRWARRSAPTGCSVRFVAFNTEEPPYTRTPHMGSAVHARGCRARSEQLTAMLSLETLGSYYFKHRGPDAPLPLRFFSPWRGDFVAAVGNLSSAALLRRVAAEFDAGSSLRCRPLALPLALRGANSSDHWAFWREGYPALMLTDTGPFRTRHYHRPTDTHEHVDYARLEAVVEGVSAVLDALAGAPLH